MKWLIILFGIMLVMSLILWQIFRVSYGCFDVTQNYILSPNKGLAAVVMERTCGGALGTTTEVVNIETVSNVFSRLFGFNKVVSPLALEYVLGPHIEDIKWEDDGNVTIKFRKLGTEILEQKTKVENINIKYINAD